MSKNPNAKFWQTWLWIGAGVFFESCLWLYGKVEQNLISSAPGPRAYFVRSLTVWLVFVFSLLLIWGSYRLKIRAWGYWGTFVLGVLVLVTAITPLTLSTLHVLDAVRKYWLLYGSDGLLGWGTMVLASISAGGIWKSKLLRDPKIG